MRRSSLAKPLPLIWLTALAITGALAGLAGCEKSPDLTHLSNPFDPASDTGGDGLQIRALTSPNQVILTWNQPQDMGITEYFIYQGDTPDGPFDEIAVVAQSAAASGTFIYNYPSPTQTHWFVAQAFTADGGFSMTSNAVPATADVGPTVVIGDTVTTLATRYPELSITVGFGDSLLIALNENFTDALRVQAAPPGTPLIVTSLDLGPTTLPDTFKIHVKSFDSLVSSTPTVMTLPVAFGPTHSLIGASRLNLASRTVDLAITATGVESMRFASNEAELATADWVPGAAEFYGYELDDTATTQSIWAQYLGDFGLTTTAELSVRADLLGGASFQLRLPSNRVVSQLTVLAELSAHATEVRLAESATFTDVPWLAYEDTLSFQLSPTEGHKTVYVQFRNDWTESNILSDYCTFVTQGPDVKILAPTDGSIVLGGTTLTIRGTTNPGTEAAAIDSVLIDLGDGEGFVSVFGTDTWQKFWTVPSFTVDTEIVLRARTWTGDIMVTDAVTVTVTQLSITTLSPVADTLLPGGNAINITGTAFGVLGGAPIDSVVVDIGSDHLVAVGTDPWSASWLPPLVAVNTAMDIVATVWAGDESVSSTTAVTVTP